jgi:hypothetical protein
MSAGRLTDIRSVLVGGSRWGWLIVRVEADAGVDRLGEGSLEGREQSVQAVVGELKRYLVGQDPTRIEQHDEVLYRQAVWTGVPSCRARSAPSRWRTCHNPAFRCRTRGVVTSARGGSAGPRLEAAQPAHTTLTRVTFSAEATATQHPTLADVIDPTIRESAVDEPVTIGSIRDLAPPLHSDDDLVISSRAGPRK